MFETQPTTDIPDRERRQQLMKHWHRTYDIGFVEYHSVNALLLKVGDAMFVDKVDEYPSEALFANVALAIESGAVLKRSLDPGSYNPTWAAYRTDMG